MSGFSQAHASKFDHFNIVVRDLEATIKEMTAAGFNLKRGQPQDNGISSAFIKIAHGGYIEFLSVQNPRDDLARYFAKVLKEKGEGPVFMAFEKSPLIQSAGLVLEKWKDFSTLSYPFSHPLSPYFLIEYHKRPDDSAFTSHDNGVIKINELHVAELPTTQKLDHQFLPLPIFLNYTANKPLVYRVVFQYKCNSVKPYEAFRKFQIDFEANTICSK